MGVNEAVAEGMAVIATETVGAAAELVRDGVNGFVVGAGDPNGMTSAVRNITARGESERLKAGSDRVLDAWRQRGDPARAVRAALALAPAVRREVRP